MTPTEFLGRYHNLAYTLGDGSTGFAQISRYQSGASGAPWAARGAVFAGIARDLRRQPGSEHVSAWNLPAAFSIEDRDFTRIGVTRVFMGKASPDEMTNVIWLAQRYGIINNAQVPTPPPNLTVQQYADAIIGLDCNAFVGHYYGLNPETEIPFYSRGARRRSKEDVQSGDIVISVVEFGGSLIKEHIALTEGFQGDTLTLVEWGSPGQNHHRSTHTVHTSNEANGDLYYRYVSDEEAHRRSPGKKYFHAPPGPPRRGGGGDDWSPSAYA